MPANSTRADYDAALPGWIRGRDLLAGEDAVKADAGCRNTGFKALAQTGAEAVARLLACRGFRVEEYGRGADLLEAVGSRRLDCLLLDLHMEGVNGFEVLQTFSARQVHMPVILITGQDEPGTEEQARRLGAVAYLKKPVDRDTLLSAISTALTHHETPSP